VPDDGPTSRTSATTWLIHPVGLGDLGIGPDPGGSLEQARLSRLQALAAARDADGLWPLIWHGRYETGGDIPQQQPAGHRHLPLPKLLRGLAAPGSKSTRVRLLLVAARSAGPRYAGLRVDDLSRALADAVRVLRPRIHDELGAAVEIVDIDGAFPAGLEERTVLAELAQRYHAQLPNTPDSAVISWGSGATSTSFSAISAVIRLRLPWRLLDYTAPARDAAVQVDPLAALDPALPPAVPYLTRLRLFHELARAAEAAADAEPQIRLTADQERAVSAMVALVDRGFRAENAEALRQVAWEALVRWDGTAGFALRRYVIARYHEMCAHLDVEPVETPEEAKKRAQGKAVVAILGKLRALATEQLAQDPTHRPNAWLASEPVGLINRYGSAAHNLTRPDPDEAEQIARWLVRWDGLSLAEADLVTRLGVRPSTEPGSGLLAVWPVGKEDRKDGVDERPSVAQQLVQNGPGEAVEQFLGSGAFPLHVLLLATDLSSPAADRQREQLTPGGDRDVTASVQLVGPDFYDRDRVRSQVRVYLTEVLARHGDTVGGLLLVPTGPKPIVLAALQEMFRVSAERGVPLFVRDLAADGTSLGGLHLWPAVVGHDRPLLTAALGALDRLELDAAARLLAGTTRAEDLAVGCQALARAFTGRDEDWTAWTRSTAVHPVEEGVDHGRLGQRLDLVHHCASRLDDGTEPSQGDPEPVGRDRNTLLTRFLVLASTLIENWRPLLCLGDEIAECRTRKWHLLDEIAMKPKDGKPPHPAQGYAAVLLTLRTTRNKIPITHNHAPDAEQAVQEAVTNLGYDKRPLPEPWPRQPSPLSLLHAAPRAAVPWDLPAAGGLTLIDQWRDLRRRLVQAIDEAGIPQLTDLTDLYRQEDAR
jgi:hypothetical protein